MRAAFPLAALAALPAAAQTPGLDCRFTMVCAPEIGCEPHEGVPIRLDATGTGFALETPGGRLEAAPARAGDDAPMVLVFPDATGSLFFSIAGSGSAALTDHRLGRADRIDGRSFYGECVPS